MKRLTLKSIGEILSIKDNRTVKKWCKRHKVNFFRDGRDIYVWEADFNQAVAAMQKTEKKTIFTPPFEKYTPKTDIGKDFEQAFSHIAA